MERLRPSEDLRGRRRWPRRAKWIPLSEAAQRALGIEDEALAPNDLIRAILRAPVDLLWNGGIGTVVKASTSATRPPRTAPATRSASMQRELRCRVVGEGGNLGLTRPARVEFAARGGHINADFIDNSAGVDCSDHEVNLKVLLGLAERAGDLTRPDRDVLLPTSPRRSSSTSSTTPSSRPRSSPRRTRRSASRLDAYEDLMVALEEDGMLDRASEALPAGEELAERRRAGRGMERPELSLLLPTRSGASRCRCWSPACSRTRGSSATCAATSRSRSSSASAQLLGEHPLRRELIATINANLVVNALGPVFVSQLVAERGARPAEVVRAYRIAREVTGAEADWETIESLEGKVEPEVQAELMGGVDGLVDAVTRWYLSDGDDGDLESTIEAGREGFARLAGGGARARRRGAARARRERRRAARRPPACPRSWRPPTRCARGSCTRRRSPRSPPPPSARSRTSRGCS